MKEKKPQIGKLAAVNDLTSQLWILIPQNGSEPVNIGIHARLFVKFCLIFDEPTSGLDYNSMVQTAELIGSLDKNITVLIVTHDMELIERCCTHILHIENGRIHEVLL